MLIIFFLVGIVKTCGSFAEVKKTEHVFRLFVRFAIAKGIITYGMDIMLSVFEILQGVTNTIVNTTGYTVNTNTVLPSEMFKAIEDCGFFESIPLWAVILIGGLVITVLSLIMIMTVYGRFFKSYMYTAISPIPLSTFAGEPFEHVGKSFAKSYCAVCLEGAIIVLACVIFSIFVASPSNFDVTLAPVTQVWTYVGELVFNMLILVESIKASDRIVREMMDYSL